MVRIVTTKTMIIISILMMSKWHQSISLIGLSLYFSKANKRTNELPFTRWRQPDKAQKRLDPGRILALNEKHNAHKLAPVNWSISNASTFPLSPESFASVVPK